MDLFACCALIAYVEISRETGIFPPDSETVRIRATKYYEEELKNTRKGIGNASDRATIAQHDQPGE